MFFRPGAALDEEQSYLRWFREQHMRMCSSHLLLMTSRRAALLSTDAVAVDRRDCLLLLSCLCTWCSKLPVQKRSLFKRVIEIPVCSFLAYVCWA